MKWLPFEEWRCATAVPLLPLAMLGACHSTVLPPPGSSRPTAAVIEQIDGKTFAGLYGPNWKVVTYHISPDGSGTADTCDGKDGDRKFYGAKSCVEGMDRYFGTPLIVYVRDDVTHIDSERTRAYMPDSRHIVGLFYSIQKVATTRVEFLP